MFSYKPQDFTRTPPPQKGYMMDFLPKDYTAPITGAQNYMKLQDGENKFRVLTRPILGWEDWIEKKPVRYRMDAKPAKPHDPTKPIKHFWAMVVFNYNEEQIQILQITQSTIRTALEALLHDTDWGAPFFYDIKIFKKGEGVNTEYTVNPVPHKPTHEYIIEQFHDKHCNLEALFDGGDPFATGQPEYTKGVFTAEAGALDQIDAEEALELQNTLAQCSEDYRKKVYNFLKSEHGITDVIKMKPDLFKKVLEAAYKKLGTE